MISVKPNIKDCFVEGVRVIMDIGSQMSFITEKVAEELKLKTFEESIPLLIKGFTGKRKVLSHTVEFPFLLGSKTHTIICLCVPEIEIKFKTPNLKELVKMLKEDGHKMAYEPFNQSKLEEVENVQCLLGARDWDIIGSLSHRLIGSKNSKQCYSDNERLIPVGSIELWIRNYQYAKDERNLSDSNSIKDISEEQVLVSTSNIEQFVHDKVAKPEIISNSIEISNLNVTCKDNDEWSDILDVDTYSELNQQCNQLLKLDATLPMDDEVSVSENEVTDFILGNSFRDEEGRHVIAIPWLSRYKTHLGSN